MWKKYGLLGLWALVLFSSVFTYYRGLMREEPRKYDPAYWYPVETRIAELAEIPRDAPPTFLPDLLKEEWDSVCFVGPLQSRFDPGLGGIHLPYDHGDRQMVFVVLLRETEYETHIFYRDEVNLFYLFGIEDYTACYNDTAVTIEYVEKPWITVSPRTLHIKPLGWSGKPPEYLR